jgi:hypothetical protein
MSPALPRSNFSVGRLLALAGLTLLGGACGGMGTREAPASDSRTSAKFALNQSDLPTCTKSLDGMAFYVWNDSAFYVCKSSTRTWVQTILNGLNAAARVTAVSPGSQCPAGGSRIEFGLDQNRNNVLDNPEVSSTVVVCNGSPGAQGPQGIAGPQGVPGTQGTNGSNGAAGLSSLVRQDPEPAGENCPAGGVAIESGLDVNGNGILEASEVAQTTYSCNGQSGSNGTTGQNGNNGLSTLISTTAEPAGPNCQNGGAAVNSGLDLNSDGTLQPTEIQHTFYVCNGTNIGCTNGLHDNGTGSCQAAVCATGTHNGGDGACVPLGACSEAYHNDGLGGCLQEGCALGFHDGGGLCVAAGNCVTGFHDNGAGDCVQSGCSLGFHDSGAGGCLQKGCATGFHNAGDETCAAV